MGSGTSGKPDYHKRFDIGRYDINKRRWTEAERSRLEEALSFMEKNFGDISEYTGEIRKQYLRGAEGQYEYRDKERMIQEGLTTRYEWSKATIFDTGHEAQAHVMVHEFTHAVAETMAHDPRNVGATSYDGYHEKFRSEVYKAAGMEEPKRDNRRWASRALEFPARMVEAYFEGDRSPLSVAAFKTLKEYWKRYKYNKSISF